LILADIYQLLSLQNFIILYCDNCNIYLKTIVIIIT